MSSQVLMFPKMWFKLSVLASRGRLAASTNISNFTNNFQLTAVTLFVLTLLFKERGSNIIKGRVYSFHLNLGIVGKLGT